MPMIIFSEEKGTVDKINKIIMEELGTLGTIKIIKPEKGSLQNAFLGGVRWTSLF